jgi:glycosyltransferase involved in cell wall biosynthesis
MKPLKISFLVRRDIKQGTYHRYHNFAVGLTQRGHQVTIYSQALQERVLTTQEVRDEVNYVLFPSAPGERLFDFGMHPANCFIRAFQNYGDADIYHLFQSFPNAAIPWLMREKMKKSLFVYDWDDLWMNQKFGLLQSKSLKERWTKFWLGWMEQNLPSSSHVMTSCSHYLADLGTQRGAPTAEVIHNGFWPYQQHDKQTSRQSLNLKQDAIYAGFMGWSAGEIDWCFKAFQKSASSFPQLRLAFCGFNPETQIKRYPELAHRIDYVGVLPSHEDCRVFDAALDLALIPLEDNDFNRSRQPLKFMDHLAGATPILCSNLGENANLAKSISGVIVCDPNPQAWSDKFYEVISQMAENPNRFTVSNEEVVEYLSWSSLAERLENVYCKYLNRY